jgi:hypothetical protein
VETVFYGYCMNCADHVYNGERGPGMGVIDDPCIEVISGGGVPHFDTVSDEYAFCHYCDKMVLEKDAVPPADPESNAIFCSEWCRSGMEDTHDEDDVDDELSMAIEAAYN